MAQSAGSDREKLPQRKLLSIPCSCWYRGAAGHGPNDQSIRMSKYKSIKMFAFALLPIVPTLLGYAYKNIMEENSVVHELNVYYDIDIVVGCSVVTSKTAAVFLDDGISMMKCLEADILDGPISVEKGKEKFIFRTAVFLDDGISIMEYLEADILDGSISVEMARKSSSSKQPLTSWKD